MAELRGWVKWALFLSSYIPLYPILAIKNWNIQMTVPADSIVSGSPVIRVPVVSVGWLMLMVASAIVLYFVISIRKRRSASGDFRSVERYKSRNDLITSYILVYIFPFVVLDFSSLVNWVVFVIFFAVIGIVQVRSNQLYVNPVLALLNYNIYEVQTEDTEMTLIIQGQPDEEVESVKVVELSNRVYLAV